MATSTIDKEMQFNTCNRSEAATGGTGLPSVTSESMHSSHQKRQMSSKARKEQRHADAAAASNPAVPALFSKRSFFGREKELQELCAIRDRIIARPANADNASPAKESQRTDKVSRGHSTSSTYPATDEGDGVISEGSRGNELDPSVYPAALVWGTSGTGKSQMVEQFLNLFCCTCGAKTVEELSQDDGRNAAAAHNTNTMAHKQETAPLLNQCTCCYVLHGKYDEYTGSKDPFSAIVQALDAFASQLKDGPSDELERIRRCVLMAYGGNRDIEDTNAVDVVDETDDAHTQSAVAAMISLVPSLSILLPSASGSVHHTASYTLLPESSLRGHRSMFHRNSNNNNTSVDGSMRGIGDHQSIASTSSANRRSTILNFHDNNGHGASANATSAWNRLRYIFIKFMKVISTPQRPVYLYLDDLQSSSSAGLELLAALISDVELENFMLLGVIRQEMDTQSQQAVELSSQSPLNKHFLTPLTSQPGGADVAAPSGTRYLKQVVIGNLSFDDSATWLSHLLDRPKDDRDLVLLAQKILKKTHGNIYFTLQAIEQLKRCDVIVYSDADHRWEWDLDQFIDDDQDLPISDDIVAAIMSRMRELPIELQHVLCIAAYIRSSFELPTLQAVLQCVDRDGGMDAEFTFASSTSSTHKEAPRFTTAPPASASASSQASTRWTTEKLNSILEGAVMERLVINSIGGSQYHFAHDRIQQAAHGLIPYGEARDKLRLRIGNCLLDMHHESNLDLVDHPNGDTSDGEDRPRQQAQISDGLLFVAVDHLNSVASKDHMHLVKINLDAGERALNVAALAPAATYLQKAAASLRMVRNAWDEHYGICVRLFRCRSEVELSLANFDVGYDVGNTLIAKANCVDDKLPTYLSMARALGRQNKSTESLELSLSVVRMLGEFPERMYLFHIMNDLRVIKTFLKKTTNEQILNMPLQDDFQKIMAMQLIKDIGVRSHLTGQNLLWLVQTCRLVRMTMRYGLCEESAIGFGGLAMFFNTAMGDHPSILRCLDISMLIFNKTGGKRASGIVHTVSIHYAFAFNRPLEKTLQLANKGYAIAMEEGEFENGLMSRSAHDDVMYCGGRNLHDVMSSLRSTIRQYAAYNIVAMRGIPAEGLVVVEYMTGDRQINWDSIDRMSHQIVEKGALDSMETFAAKRKCECHAILALMFQRYDIASRCMQASLQVRADHFRSIGCMAFRILPSGLVAAGMFRKTNKRKYKAEVKMHTKTLKEILSKKGQNVASLFLLLNAERISLKTPKFDPAGISRAQKAYDTAILVAEKSEMMQYAAMACEFAGEYFIRILNTLTSTNGSKSKRGDDTVSIRRRMKESIRGYMTRSVDFYRRWGCVIKVQDITERRSAYLESSMATNGDAKNGNNNRNHATSGHQQAQNVFTFDLVGKESVKEPLHVLGEMGQLSAIGGTHEYGGVGSIALTANGDKSRIAQSSRGADSDSADNVSVLTDESG